MFGPDTQRERQLALQVSATIPAFATRAPQTDSRFQFVWDIRRVALAAMLLAVILTGALPGGMAGASALPKLTLKTGEGQLVKLDRAATAVFVANPEIADVQVSSGKAFFVFGVKTGRTTVYAVNGSGQTIYARDIRVTHDLDAMVVIPYPVRLNTDHEGSGGGIGGHQEIAIERMLRQPVANVLGRDLSILE